MSAHSYRNASGLFPAEQLIFDGFAGRLSTLRLLDIGIGTGRTSAALSGRVGSYAGCDYSPAMIEAARQRCPGLDLRLADARNLTGHASESFDIVLFSYNGMDGVGHADRLRILSEVRRVLIPGGHFVFATHNRRAPRTPVWSRANLDIGWNPYRLARGLALFGLGFVNRLRLKRFESEATDYAIVNDAAHQYGLLHYYIDAADQVRQLEAAGFEVLEACDLAGGRFDPLHDVREDYMIHFLARRR